MDESKEYLILRYSLIEDKQSSLDFQSIPAPKGKAVLIAINQEREFAINGSRYSFVGFSEVKPSFGFTFPSSRFFFGKIARLKKLIWVLRFPEILLKRKKITGFQ